MSDTESGKDNTDAAIKEKHLALLKALEHDDDATLCTLAGLKPVPRPSSDALLSALAKFSPPQVLSAYANLLWKRTAGIEREQMALARACAKLVLIDEALGNYYRILKEKPDHLQAIREVCALLVPRARFSEALRLVEAARTVFPQEPSLLYFYAFIKQASGEHEEALAAFDLVSEMPGPLAIKAGKQFIVSMAYLPDLTQKDIQEASEAWERKFARPTKRRPIQRHPGRIRLGYYSPDFRRHSIASFIPPLLEAHDRDKFELFLYSDSGHKDELTEHYRTLAEHWRDIQPLDTKAAINALKKDRLDILVDLAGHFGDSRPWLFAERPAQRQAHLVGYNGSTGLHSLDYRFTDAVCEPEGSESESSEKLIRLSPGFLLYRPLVRDLDPGPPPHSLNGKITFGSFNNSSKINDAVIDLWCRILKSVPTASLLLKATQLKDPALGEALAARFTERGIESERIDILPAMEDDAAHLGMYRRVDIALDSFPLNGTTTTCEALWMGVPVLTIMGKRHSERISASILKQIGLDEAVAQNEDEYLNKACEWAATPERLAQWRTSLREAVESRLGNAPAYARQLEAAYMAMLEQ
ncbi:MAG: hypothetical protein JW942_01355 [Opitutales bacterium]|nr:hypothetical protein [Opitutales bacterium]